MDFQDMLLPLFAIATIIIVYLANNYPKKELDMYLKKGLTSKRLKNLLDQYHIEISIGDKRKINCKQIGHLIKYLQMNGYFISSRDKTPNAELFIKSLSLTCTPRAIVNHILDCPPDSKIKFDKMFK